jgi:hypothetical protein
MAYSSALPAYLIVSNPAGGLISTSTSVTGGGGNLWFYRSADAMGTVTGSSYFTNGAALGMKKYDVVLILDTGSTELTMGLVTAVTANGAATVGALASSSS